MRAAAPSTNRVGARSNEREGAPSLKMRAAVLEQFAQPLQITEVDLADPGPGEVLVRLAA